MPITTYLGIEPESHEDTELQELLDELSKKTGVKWWAKTYIAHVTKRFFGPDKTHTYTELLKDMGLGEAQVFGCVSTVREAKAYLLGALGHISITPNVLIMSDLEKLTTVFDSIGIEYVLRESGEYKYLFFGECRNIHNPGLNFESSDLKTLLVCHKYIEFENEKLASYFNS